jgi:DNA primase
VAGRIPQQFIDELLLRVDIVDVIDERVPLKKLGKDFKACCPFHNEKTPSFTVSTQKQFYHCFGCGAHGTVIGFLMDYDHMEFPAAIEELAERAGLTVPHEGGPARDDGALDGIYEILVRAAEYFRRQLREHGDAASAVGYLKKRGVSGRVAADFGLGFAPSGWDNMLKALGSNEAQRRQLLAAGLTIQKDGDRYYDRFRERLMFPILDRRGRVVGFGGRVLGDGEPKYLNSPETPVFHKGRELYGLFQLRRTLARPATILVVEGYMDVVALAEHGITYAVATLGTSATREHLEQIFRASAHVVFCFDGDRAGRAAAWRALETTLPLMRDGHQASFMFLPEGEDPDTMVRKLGQERFEKQLSKATSLATFLFDHLGEEADLSTLDGRARLVELARPLLRELPPGAFRELAGQRLAELSGMNNAGLTTLIDGGEAPKPRRRQTPVRASASPSLVRRAILILLHHPSLAAKANPAEALRALELPGIPLLLEIIELLHRNPNLSTGALVEHFRDLDAGRHLAKLAMSEAPEYSEALERELTDCFKKLSQLLAEQRYAYLTRKAHQGTLTDEERVEFRRPARER